MKPEPLLRSVVHLAGGSAIGQIALVVSTPILARMYGPESFGTFAAFASASLLLAAVSSLRYETAIPLASSDSEAAALVRLAGGIALTTTVIIGAVVVAGRAWGVKLDQLAIPMAATPVAMYQVYSNWALRCRDTLSLGKTRVYQSVATAGVQIALGVLGSGTYGLIVGEIAGRSVGVYSLRSKVKLQLKRVDVNIGRPGVARQYRKFALYLMPATIASAAAVQLPMMLIPKLFGQIAAGQYYMVLRFGMGPSLLIGSAVSQAMLSHLGSTIDLESVNRTATRLLVVLAAIYLPLYAVFLTAGPFVAEMILGREWSNTGIVARQIAPMLLMWSLASPLSVILVIARRERESLVIACCDVTARSLCLWLGWRYGSIDVAMLGLGVVGGVVGTITLARCFRVVHSHIFRVALQIWPAAILGGAGAIATRTIINSDLMDWGKLMMVGGIAITSAAIAVLIAGRQAAKQ